MGRDGFPQAPSTNETSGAKVRLSTPETQAGAVRGGPETRAQRPRSRGRPAIVPAPAGPARPVSLKKRGFLDVSAWRDSVEYHPWVGGAGQGVPGGFRGVQRGHSNGAETGRRSGP
jgi:hypothetical protein